MRSPPVISDCMSSSDSLEEMFKRDELHFAAEDGDLGKVTQLLQDGHDPNAFDYLGRTPLHCAAKGGHLDVMRLLLSSGADINAHDESVIGDTALAHVAANCSFDVAKILVDAGADPTIPGGMMLTALDKSKERKKPEGVRVHELLVQTARRFRPGRIK